MRSIGIVVEVALLDAAVLERELAEQARGQAERDAALDLRLEPLGLTASPQSTPAVTAWTRILPFSIETSATSAMIDPND